MALAINDTAPDFEAETTEGKIKFHDWIGDKWVVLFSHPKDFTPVCTTELGYMAKIKPEFDKRGVKIIGLSVDPVDKHSGWAADIKETQGFAPNYPMIGDVDYNVSKLYGMLPAAISGDPAKRTAADNQTVRNVFIIGPDKKIKLILTRHEGDIRNEAVRGRPRVMLEVNPDAARVVGAAAQHQVALQHVALLRGGGAQLGEAAVLGAQ